jgi:proteasome lid subunit RPN8/RPN11
MSNRIRFGDPLEPEPPVEALPPAALILRDPGGWQRARFQVYILQSVYDEIWNHINQTRHLESGGVLVGHPFKTFDQQITFVIVTGAIPQHSDSRSVGHFTVSPAEVAQTRTEMERAYPGLAAVGWFHSHPGHGVFLSSQDMTIVRSIYNASWHIAMVIDPKNQSEGVFVGTNGTRLGGQDYDRIGSSWISLREVPDSVKAIALYNQSRESQTARSRIQNLVQQSEQLRHWRRRGYREFAASPPASQPPVYLLPEPARREAKADKTWLWFSTFNVALLWLFFCVVALKLPQGIGSQTMWGVLSFGFVFSILAAVTAWRYAVTAEVRPVTQTDKDNPLQQFSSAYSLVVIILIVLGWYAFSMYTYSVYWAVSESSPTTLPENSAITPPLLPNYVTSSTAETPGPFPTQTLLSPPVPQSP